MIVLTLTLPAWAGGAPATLSGIVRDSSGVAQMGATVEVFAASVLPVARVFTDAKGFFAAADLNPGTYYVKVTAPSFLPAVQEDIGLKAGANLAINVTLNTLFEAMQMVPLRRRTAEDQDDWRWALRSAANRPILRVLDDGPMVVSKGDGSERTLKARVAVLAGSEGSGLGATPDMTTTVKLERSLFSSGTLAVGGDVGYSAGVSSGGALRASYSYLLPNGSEPQMDFEVRHFAPPGMGGRDALDAMALSASDRLSLFDRVDLNLGSEYQAIQFIGRASALRPFASAALHLSPANTLTYGYATAVPGARALPGFDNAPADLSDSGPRVSRLNSDPVLERAQHHELSLSHVAGNNTFEVAGYSDRISSPILAGVGEVTQDSGDFLPDYYSGSFTWSAPDLSTSGVRAVVQRRLSSELKATLDYSYGGVLALTEPGVGWSEMRSAMATQRRHALTGKMAGTLAATHTRWVTSYQWTSGEDALTRVDMFNTSAGQSVPFLGFLIRQPIPGTGSVPGHMEALVDVRNLLAQGYVPVLGNGGRTLYLVQAPREIRGGVAFTF
jgi:hypothetical protein